MSITGNDCAESCKENEEPDINKMCVCDENSILHEDGDRCVLRDTCKRTFETEAGVVCLAKEICTGDLKLLLNDEHRCVEDCSSWVLENSGEQRCVAKCPEPSFVGPENQCVTCTMLDE